MMSVFENNAKFTESIKGEVIEYVKANWESWGTEEWLTSKFIASVGDEYLPRRTLEMMSVSAISEGKHQREVRELKNMGSMKEVIIMLSTVDVLTDAYMIYLYHTKGLENEALNLLLMLGTNMLVQIILVCIQYSNKNWRGKTKEILITLLFLRPIVDAYRIHFKVEDSQIRFDPLTEMILNKCVDLATESIPGCFLQCYVLLLNPDIGGGGAIASLVISAFTTGLTSAMIAFDMDTDKPHRELQVSEPASSKRSELINN